MSCLSSSSSIATSSSFANWLAASSVSSIVCEAWSASGDACCSTAMLLDDGCACDETGLVSLAIADGAEALMMSAGGEGWDGGAVAAGCRCIVEEGEKAGEDDDAEICWGSFNGLEPLCSLLVLGDVCSDASALPPPTSSSSPSRGALVAALIAGAVRGVAGAANVRAMSSARGDWSEGGDKEDSEVEDGEEAEADVETLISV